MHTCLVSATTDKILTKRASSSSRLKRALPLALVLAFACRADAPVAPHQATPQAKVSDTLTVAASHGVIVSLPVGSRPIEHGAVVSYQFTASPGYEALVVQLDGHPVSLNGTFTVSGSHRLIATADSIATSADFESTATSLWKDLVARPDDPASSRTLLQRRVALLFKWSAVDVEALTRLGMVRLATGFQDISAMRRILTRADSMQAAAIQASGGVQTVSNISAVVRSNAVATEARVGIIYVNGMLSGTEGAPLLQGIVGSAASVIPVENPSATRDEVVKFWCMVDAAALMRSGLATSAVSYVVKCGVAETAAFLIDLGETLNQLVNGNTRFFSDISKPVVADIVATASGLDGVVLVGHSQGNLFVQDALTQLRGANYPRECLGYVAIASPRLPAAGLTAMTPQHIVAGDANSYVRDFVSTVSGEGPFPNELSTAWNETVSWWNSLFAIPLANYELHSLSASYLGTPSSSVIIRSNINAQLQTIRSGCLAARSGTSAARLEIDPSEVTLPEGSIAPLRLQAFAANGAVVTAPSVAWSSANPSVVSVNGAGVASAISAGATDIHATSANLTATSHVVVTSGAVQRVVVQPSSTTLPIGGQKQFRADAFGAAGQLLSGRTVSWSSSNLSAAAVTQQGFLTAIANGSGEIRATIEGVSGTSTVVVSSAPTLLAPTLVRPGTSLSPGPTISSTSPTIEWTAVAGALTYGLHIRDITAGSVAYDNDNVGAVTSLSLPSNSLTGGHGYRWYMDARTGTSVSAASRYMYFQTSSGGTVTPTVSLGASPSSIASGQSATLTWSSANAALCVGSWASGTGQVAANGSALVSPTTTINYSILCSAATPSSATASASAIVSVAAPATSALSITTTALPSATVGTGYGQGLVATGGQTPYTWAVSAGLPPGLSINSSVGSIFGTPTASGTFNFTVTVTDASSPTKTASQSLSITVTGSALPPAAPTLISPGSAASPGPTLTTLTPTFLWSAVSGATGYGLYIRDLTTGNLVYNNTAVGNVTSAVPITLVAGHSYRWNMQASNGAGFSGYTSDYFFKR